MISKEASGNSMTAWKIAQSTYLLNDWPFDASVNEDEIIMVAFYLYCYPILTPQFKRWFFRDQIGDEGKTESSFKS